MATRLLEWILTPVFLVIFILLFLIFHPIFLLTHALSPTWYRRAIDISNLCLVLNLRIIGTSVKVIRSANTPEGLRAIYASNHQSLFDIPILLWYLRHAAPQFVSKRELGRWLPSISHALRHMGAVLIDRSKGKSSLLQIEDFGARTLKRNESAVIFPEGTRTRTGSLGKFKGGGLTTLARAMPGIPVVPIVIQGTYRLTKDSMLPLPIGQKVTVSLLDPIEVNEASIEDLPALIHARIEEALEAIDT